jgi:hypothetical protein
MFGHLQRSIGRETARVVRIAWFRLWRGPCRADESPSASLYAVRRDWPDLGHDFFGLSESGSETALRAASLPSYWQRFPSRPIQSVVRISRNDFELHRARSRGRVRCLAPDCSVPAERWKSSVEGTVWR